MEQILATIGNIGSPALNLVVVLMFFRGDVLAKKTVQLLLESKDLQIRQQKDYYEGRLTDITESHRERATDLRHVAETNARALQTAVDNAQKLIGQNDDLLEVARTAAPALLAARQAAEAIGNGHE